MLVLPLPSFTVKVTVFAPVLLQVNELGVTDTKLTVPQLSEPEAYTCEGVIDTVPPAPTVTAMFWQVTAGGWLSVTVTLKLQAAVCPLAAVT